MSETEFTTLPSIPTGAAAEAAAPAAVPAVEAAAPAAAPSVDAAAPAAPASVPAAEAAVRFADFGLSPDILRALNDQGYVHPTPIQAQAIPIVLQGRDVMGAAQTGTGKTAGFSLPIIQLLLAHASSSMSPARHPVRALVLTPTRELAVQVAENVKAYARHTPLRSTVVFGGMDMAPQTAALRAGVEIVIATPGRLLDHVQQKTLNLSQVQILVMDEADRMLDMGFLPDLQRIINMLPKQRQNLMFSATFSGEIKKLAGSFLNNPLLIEVARSNQTADKVTQVVYKVADEHKRDVVAHLIRGRDLKQILIFSNTKIGASRLARSLEQEGVKCTAIHGDKTQQERMAALEAFKKGEIDVLVATDVAARGLDITDLPCVINFDLPYNAEDYVHRIGRTGRAGASGDAISIFSDKDERLLLDIEKLIKQTITRGELAGFTPTAIRAGAERGERGERTERGEGRRPRPPFDATEARPPRPAFDAEARAPRQAASSGDEIRSSMRPPERERGRSSNGPLPRREKADPWFSKPYEPAAAAAPMVSSALPVAKPKQKVAALLGGLRKH
ncbi:MULTISPECIES: DEAD/DEAH box helicase [unclassified Janthinobacterium]|uniref:DEAD/DEAH box helicase n=1 Tax=unclassified Janthinobacterium TaxID=2610881 RepID=UPI0003480BF7|nr:MULTISPECIES: DEAD/DEAH box helicase [unclassified Janthinobacterium]MEC5159785.1 ATP-dependent RNA helicase RhlE [Janthinobacterium sp. CG_S6]